MLSAGVGVLYPAVTGWRIVYIEIMKSAYISENDMSLLLVCSSTLILWGGWGVHVIICSHSMIFYYSSL